MGVHSMPNSKFDPEFTDYDYQEIERSISELLQGCMDFQKVIGKWTRSADNEKQLRNTKWKMALQNCKALLENAVSSFENTTNIKVPRTAQKEREKERDEPITEYETDKHTQFSAPKPPIYRQAPLPVSNSPSRMIGSQSGKHSATASTIDTRLPPALPSNPPSEIIQFTEGSWQDVESSRITNLWDQPVRKPTTVTGDINERITNLETCKDSLIATISCTPTRLEPTALIRQTDIMYQYSLATKKMTFNFKQKENVLILDLQTVATRRRDDHLVLAIAQTEMPDIMFSDRNFKLQLQAVFPNCKEYKNIIELKVNPKSQFRYLSVQQRGSDRLEFLFLLHPTVVCMANCFDERDFTSGLNLNHFKHSIKNTSGQKIIDLAFDSQAPEDQSISRFALLHSEPLEKSELKVSLVEVSRSEETIVAGNERRFRSTYTQKDSKVLLLNFLGQIKNANGVIDLDRTRMIYNSKLNVLLIFLFEFSDYQVQKLSARMDSSEAKKREKERQVHMTMFAFGDVIKKEENDKRKKGKESLLMTFKTDKCPLGTTREAFPKFILKSNYDSKSEKQSVLVGFGDCVAAVHIARGGDGKDQPITYGLGRFSMKNHDSAIDNILDITFDQSVDKTAEASKKGLIPRPISKDHAPKTIVMAYKNTHLNKYALDIPLQCSSFPVTWRDNSIR